MLDDKTEMIAHFIGIFELNTEAARLKVQYQEFTALTAQNPELGQLFNITIDMTSAYGLLDYVTKFEWPLAFVSVPVNNFSLLLPSAMGFVPFRLPTFFDEEFFLGGANVPSASKTIFEIPLPSQVATITVQENYLEDMDILNTYEGNADFIPASIYNAGLEYLQSVADTLQPLRAPELATDEDHMHETGVALSDEVSALQDTGLDPVVEGAEIYAVFNEDIDAITVNGASAEEMLDLGEHSHRFASEDEEEDAEETNDAKSVSGEALTEEDVEGDNHEVTSGGNVLLNEGVLTTNWLDAPVISVMGKVIVADIISQVNVWSDVDMINGALHSDDNPTQAYNAAHFEKEANSAHTPLEEGEKPGDGPSNVVVVTLEGNLVNYNHVKQFNFANDGDILSVGFSANDTFIQAGDNTLVNATSILGLGFHYDLIMVDGDIIDVAFLSQTNVMLDSDTLTHQAGFAGDISTSDNLLWNWGRIKDYGVDSYEGMNEAYGKASGKFSQGKHDVSSVKGDSAFAEMDLLRVLHVKGSILEMQVLEQFNILGDGDQVEWASRTVKEADGADVSVTTGHNELLNMATITDAGIDSTIYTSEGAYTDAFLYQADFVSDDDPLALADLEGLAGEAFLFLADGILEQEQGEDAGIHAPQPTEVAVDVMQTVLA